jgi:dimethylargininase
VLSRFDKVLVPEDEAYAANALSVNGTIVMPDGFPKTVAAVRGAGFDVVTLRMTEFPKCEGAMTCLSILL